MRAFFCEECDSQSVAVSGPLGANAQVVCGECGSKICLWAEFIAGLSKAHAADDPPGTPRLRIITPLLKI